MRTSYYLVTAAGLTAAAVIVYTKFPGLSGARELPAPAKPLAADPPPFKPADMALPPIVTPPDAPLVIPAGSSSRSGPSPVVPAIPVPPVTPDPLPTPPPSVPTPEPPPLASPPIPLVPPVVPVPTPAKPSGPVDVAKPATPVAPVAPPAAPPAEPVKPVTPVLPQLGSPTPLPPLTTPPVAPPPSSVLPKPAPLPTPSDPPPAGKLPLLPPPSSDSPPQAGAGKFIVLKGNRLVEGSVVVAGEKVVIRQGSLEQTVAKVDVQFVAETKDEVRKFMLAKVPAGDAAARLGVARWLMFAGLREQALAEAKDVLKLQPTYTAAAELARSLDESLKQFPAEGTPAPKPPGGGTLVSVEPEPDVTPEGVTSFATRAQPVLANQCMECHARPDYPGAFKLVRVTGFEVGPQSTKANLRATAEQLKKDDPLNSPLLTKALAAHGGMKQPAFATRQAAAFRVLEAWVLTAVTPVVPPMSPPAEPVLPATPPATVAPPMTPPMMPPAAPPMVPPAAPAPVTPILPPVEPVPAVPSATVPQVPPVLPTPPSIPPADEKPKVPAAPKIPVIPPAEDGPKIPAVEAPKIPVIPPAAALPKPPGDVRPAAGAGEFGTQAPPKPPAPTGPTGGDEFDPEPFNKGRK
jgi:hypothetical protein